MMGRNVSPTCWKDSAVFESRIPRYLNAEDLFKDGSVCFTDALFGIISLEMLFGNGNFFEGL